MTSGKNPQPPWLEAAQQFQQNLVSQWTQVAQAFPGAAGQAPGPAATDPWAAFKALMPQGGAANAFAMPAPGGQPGLGDVGQMFNQAAGHPVSFDPAQMMEIQSTYLKEVGALWNHGMQAKPASRSPFCG